MPSCRRLFVLLPLTLFISACGTMMDGQTQQVTLVTPGATEAECTLSNGNTYQLQSGETIEIMRSRNDLVADCYAIGNRHKTLVIERQYNKWGARGAVFPPGLIYDHFSNGLYTYPDVITVDFSDVEPAGFAMPSYMNEDAEKHSDQKIEYYGPSTTRQESDKGFIHRPIDRIDAQDRSSNPFSVNTPSGTTEIMPSAQEAPVIPRGGEAESLTRSMNPAVF